MPRKNPSTPDQLLGEVKEQFREWRRTRKSPRPMPEELWQAAVSLSANHSIRHIGCRDRFIGWNHNLRKVNLHLMAYNSRFLVLPWVRVPHLASHILGRISRLLANDWQTIYNHPVYYLETFVDKDRFAGTCYKAANWIYLGDTTGRGKNDHTHRPNRSIKAVWGYPLDKQFRRRLGAP